MEFQELDLQCPISKLIFSDAVSTVDGCNFEKEMIQLWLYNHDTNPVTNLVLESKDLVPNNFLRKYIQSKLQANKHLIYQDMVYLPESKKLQYLDAILNKNLEQIKVMSKQDVRLLWTTLQQEKSAMEFIVKDGYEQVMKQLLQDIRGELKSLINKNKLLQEQIESKHTEKQQSNIKQHKDNQKQFKELNQCYEFKSSETHQKLIQQEKQLLQYKEKYDQTNQAYQIVLKELEYLKEANFILTQESDNQINQEEFLNQKSEIEQLTQQLSQLLQTNKDMNVKLYDNQKLVSEKFSSELKKSQMENSKTQQLLKKCEDKLIKLQKSGSLQEQQLQDMKKQSLEQSQNIKRIQQELDTEKKNHENLKDQFKKQGDLNQALLLKLQEIKAIQADYSYNIKVLTAENKILKEKSNIQETFEVQFDDMQQIDQENIIEQIQQELYKVVVKDKVNEIKTEEQIVLQIGLIELQAQYQIEIQDNGYLWLIGKNTKISDFPLVFQESNQRNVQKIKIYQYKNNVQSSDAQQISKALNQVKNLIHLTLHLQENNVQDDGACAIAESIEKMEFLETLDLALYDNNISDKGAKQIGLAVAQLKQLTILELYLFGNKIGTEGIIQIAKSLENKNMVKDLKLYLSKNNAQDQGTIALANSIGEMNLNYLILNLSANNLKAEGAIAISNALSKLINLSSLDLDLQANPNIGTIGVEALALTVQKFINLDNLKINLGGTLMKDKGAEVLVSAVSKLTNLKHLMLYLSLNKIRDKVAIKMGGLLEKMTNLQTLKLDMIKNNISESSKQQIQSKLLQKNSEFEVSI